MSKCKHRQSHYDFLYTVSKKLFYWVSLSYITNSLTKEYFSWDRFLVVARNSSQNENTFDFLWAVFTKKSYWVTLLWSASRCVYFKRPNTSLLCIFLFCIFLLYRTDPQVEVQIRILLKDKYVKLCQNTKKGQSQMISCTQFLRRFLYFTETSC